MEADPQKRRQLEIEWRLAEDASRPVLLYSPFATYMRPRLRNRTTITNTLQWLAQGRRLAR